MWTAFSACEREFRGPDDRADEPAAEGGQPQNSTAGLTGTVSRSRALKTRRAGTDLALKTRSINPLGAWLDDQSADSIPPLLRAIAAHRSAGLLRRTSRGVTRVRADAGQANRRDFLQKAESRSLVRSRVRYRSNAVSFTKEATKRRLSARYARLSTLDSTLD